MKKIKIGKSNVTTTILGLGTNAIGGHNLFKNLSNETGVEIVKTAITGGVSLLDTAFVYGMGESEKLIGKAIKDYDRTKIQIATKGAQRITSDGQVIIDNSPEFLRKTVDDSLARLNTDYIDIFYLHFPDPEHKTPLNEAISTLNDLKKAGKIRAIGVSNLNFSQLKEANQDGYVDVDEEEYSLIHRQMENDRFDYLKKQKISFIPFFPLASGLLTGKYKQIPIFPVGDIRHDDPNFKNPNFKKINKKLAILRPIAEEHKVTIAQLVLAWYLHNPAITVVIPGAKKIEQVKDNIKASQITLNDKEYEKIDDIFK